jgi:AcrR family transcriptional regulator
MIVLVSPRMHAGTRLVKNEHSFYSAGMPKVSDAHRAARRRQILDAATRCFIRDGFHATSMQDVFRESGLSAGAVYRYFPGKRAIVIAIAEQTLGEIGQAIDRIVDAEEVPTVEEALARMLAVVDGYTGPDGPARIAVQVWGEAQRDAALGEFVTAGYLSIRSRLVHLVRRAQAEGTAPSGADPERLGAVLFGAMLGYILQRLLIGDLDPAAYRAGLHPLLDPAGTAVAGAATAGGGRA